MKLNTIIVLFILLHSWFWLNSCQSETDYSKPLFDELDIQGHRGCRGSLPENSLAGFIQALEWGVTTLEMDVVISKDHKVVLSHEPFISHLICLDSLGNEIDSASHFQYNMYQMNYQEIQQYDCGSRTPPGYPHQQPVAGPKPLLSEVIKAVEQRREELELPEVRYNIETKSMMGFDRIFHPEPAQFIELVLNVIHEQGIAKKTIIQSFDPRTLKELKKQDPQIATALLVNKVANPLHDFIQLGFEPDIYSPDHRQVTDTLVTYLHQKNIAIIPWTVNEQEEMKRYIAMGVDGIITDYPQRLLELLGR